MSILKWYVSYKLKYKPDIKQSLDHLNAKKFISINILAFTFDKTKKQKQTNKQQQQKS